MTKGKKDIGASVRARLLRLAQDRGPRGSRASQLSQGATVPASTKLNRRFVTPRLKICSLPAQRGRLIRGMQHSSDVLAAATVGDGVIANG
jgi:hypothetical protein